MHSCKTNGKQKKVSILVGARLDKHNLIDNPIVSPRFNFRYNPREWINMRASFSTGFRAPQAFDEDLHIDVLNGEAALIQLADDLETEKSQSYNVSVDLYKNLGKVKTNLLIEGFYTNLDDVFVLEEIGTDSEGNTIKEKRNGSGGNGLQGLISKGKLFRQIKSSFNSV